MEDYTSMEDYKYYGLELTANVFKELLIELYDGKQFKRQDAIDTIVSFHKDHGGFTNKNGYVAVFKNASRRLSNEGLENIGYGTWRLNYKKETLEIVEEQKSEDISYTVDKIIGEGNNAVYVYYYDTYKELAELKDQAYWECKIGRTDREPIQRVLNQAGTCHPEYPHIALVINCPNSNVLESALHNTLKLRGRHLPDAPGDEWFITSPDEIEDIYYKLTNSYAAN